MGIVILAAAEAYGEAGCASCHPKQAAAHAVTNHARSLRPVAYTEFAKALPDRPIGEARGGFLLSYDRDGDALAVTAQRGGQKAARARIDWAFGAGDQGVTPLAFLNGRWLEHRISYYPKAGRFDLTLGHQPGPSATAEAAIGVPQPEPTLRACLGCHATLGQGATVTKAGIDCVRCHAGADDHARNPATAARPQRPRLETCAECHRLTPPSGDGNDKLNIRFQPLRLVKSKCYLAGQITCANCHAPHENARRADARYYEARCLACHAKPHRQDACMDCHMPKSSPAPYLTFTDHYIRRRP